MRPSWALLLTMVTACTGATIGSGVGDTFPGQPPYVAGGNVPDDARIMVLPVIYQRGGAGSSLFDPADAAESPAARLVAEMTAALDSLGGTAEWVSVPESPTGTPPDVYFGCEYDAIGDCVARGDSVLGRRGTTMHLALGRPSERWVTDTRRLLDAANATHALLVTVEVGRYWVRQGGLPGHKRVELGRDHSVALPWLTSLEAPVRVLQVTAVLVDRDGRGARIAAEGIAPRSTPLLASGVGAERLITDEDVEQLRSYRRTDLPGAPLAWRVALRRVKEEVTLSGHLPRLAAQ